MKIAYLGPEGTYSHLAARKYSGNAQLLAYNSFAEVMRSVGAHADIAVVPIENSIEGAVSECYDLLAWDFNLNIIDETVLEIDNRLITRADAAFDRIKTIKSHSQAYNQCRNYISKHFPDAEIIFSASTIQAVDGITDASVAAIAGVQAVKEGLKATDYSVQDRSNNCTRFIVLSKAPKFRTGAAKATIVFEAEDKPGGLLELLEILRSHNLNMSHIESRPHKSALGRYVFFVDFFGNTEHSDTALALEKIKAATPFYKFLGNY